MSIPGQDRGANSEESVNVALINGRAICIGLTTLLVACHHAPPHLPSRPMADLFPRGSSPPQDCPGQYRAALESAGGSFFMGCWGIKTIQQ
jgi:hypothetical protein